jgi:hypothetical protein
MSWPLRRHPVDATERMRRLDRRAGCPALLDAVDDPSMDVARRALGWLAREGGPCERDAQLAATHSLLTEVREHLRRQRAEFAHERAGPEVDSWQRAIWTTAAIQPPPATAVGQYARWSAARWAHELRTAPQFLFHDRSTVPRRVRGRT